MLDWPYAHLLVNHFPIILTYLGLAAALVAVVRRRRVAWLYALVTLTLAGAGAYPALLTGQQAGPVMEKRWYVEEAAVDAHEEAGETALWILLAMGALSAYGSWRLLRSRVVVGNEAGAFARDLPMVLRAAVVIAALAGAAAVSYAAYEGGMIVHKAPRLDTPPGTAGAVRVPASLTGRP